MKLSVLFVGLLALAGCGPFRRAHTPLPPPTPMPARIPDQVSSTEPAPPPKNLPAPPALATAKPDARPTATATMSIPGTPTEPPPRPVKAKKAPRKTVAAAPPPAVVEPVPEAEAQPVYRLGELRSPEEKEKLRQQTEQMIGICSAALSMAEGKQLSAMQTEMVNRVRSFAAQARETMDKDPGEARSIAAKGRTFAEALLAELK